MISYLSPNPHSMAQHYTVPWQIPLILLFLFPSFIHSHLAKPNFAKLNNLYIIIELKQLSIDRNIPRNSLDSLKIYEHKYKWIFNKDRVFYFTLLVNSFSCSLKWLFYIMS